MKVFLTGGTGFVGSHTALALLEAGHELRLLARAPAKAKAHFAKYNYTVNDIVNCDMRDTKTMLQAIKGCDAVIHCAAMVSMDSSHAKEMYENNMASIDSVIGSAVKLGIGNIIYVSSLTALFQPGASSIDEYSPLGKPRDPYAKSKRDCDAVVRSLQAQGAPIQITYPSGVLGPDDPKLSESNRALKSFVKSMVPITTSGIQLVDVRDVALAHKYLVENPVSSDPERARYIIAGHFYAWNKFHQLLENVTDKKIKSSMMSGPFMRFLGETSDFIRRFYPLKGMAFTGETTRIVTQWVEADSRKILHSARMEFRSGDETLKDTLRWLVAGKHLRPNYIGSLAETGERSENNTQEVANHA